MKSTEFKDATRQQQSIVAPLERRALHALARRMPAWVTPDHLTLLGLLAMALAGLCYYFSRWNPNWLHVVNFWILVNWFGDSLDGTLARFRNKQRPRYGFYVDHIVDAFGTLFLVGGMALSGYMSDRIAAAVLIAYFMLSINVYLATYTIGEFKLSFWKFSPTELRILLVIGNLALFRFARVEVLGESYRLFDVGGVIGIFGMMVILVISTIRNTRKLYNLERV